MTTENPPDNTPEQADAERHAPGRPRRRSSVVAASVAAAVLLAGGGGAYWASTASDGDSGGSAASDGGDPPPLRLDGYGEQHGRGDGGPGIAPGEPDPSGARYTAEGKLPEGPGTAPVYRPGDEVSRERAEQLAKALDVPGKARSDGDSWTFGSPKDGSGPALEVGRKAPGNWTYHRYGKGGPDHCAQQDGEGGGKPAARCPAPGDSADGDGKAVAEDEAKKAAGPVLDAIGLSDAKLDASRALGAVRTVNAKPVLDGLPSYGWQTGLQVGSDGQLVGGSGRLAELVKGAEYPLMNAEQALKRLNAERGGDGRVGIGGCASAVPHQDGDAATKPQPCTLPSKEPGAGTVKPAQSKISDAELGQAVHFVDGEPALVPSWLFEVELPGSESTSTVTYPAVQPGHIARGGKDTAAPPESRPGGPGEEDAAGKAVNIVSYQVDGRTLTLHFWGGVCTDYSASAEVSGDTVKARVTGVEKNPGQPCIKIAKMYEKQVELEESPGDREVVDAADGKALPDKAPELK